ncbi:MAG TPA: hypothetical protein VGD43_11535 [Micromonospora sp.]
MTELWNWRVDGPPVAPRMVYLALADVLGLAVMPLAAADPGRFPLPAVLCDLWHTPGEFPIRVDCYGVPDGGPEPTALAAFARRLGRDCLMPDDTLDAGRHLLAGADGTMRPVHLDARETDDGEVLTNRRLCTLGNPECQGWSHCHRSRWAPDSVVPALAAA